ncbi:MAG: GDP-L-fucose synthase [Myxococcales bacterium]
MGYFENRKIVVTGGAGFLGSYILARLKDRGAKHVFVPEYPAYDLVDRAQIKRLYDEAKPDVVIHLAAVVGGIGANRANPGKYFYDNLMMGAQLLDEGRLRRIEKFVGLGTICAYPKFTPVPFREDDLWNGYPEETNAPYGLAKKMMLVQSQAYRAQYGFNSIFLLPVNLYGPRDNFDLEASHVIPALIRKFLEAKKEGRAEVVLWGDGTPTREFLHADDAAEGILLATERYEKSEPVNIGSGMEISIKDLSIAIGEACGYCGKIVWDATKPNGQPRRRLDVTRAEREFGFKAKKDFRQGIAETIAWYKQHAGL